VKRLVDLEVLSERFGKFQKNLGHEISPIGRLSTLEHWILHKPFRSKIPITTLMLGEEAKIGEEDKKLSGKTITGGMRQRQL
jgi:hypothetical protein